MDVFAPFAPKRAKPRTPSPRAVLNRTEVVENAKKAHHPNFRNLVEKSALGWGRWVGLGWTGLGCFEYSQEALDWVETGLAGFFKKNI